MSHENWPVTQIRNSFVVSQYIYYVIIHVYMSVYLFIFSVFVHFVYVYVYWLFTFSFNTARNKNMCIIPETYEDVFIWLRLCKHSVIVIYYDLQMQTHFDMQLLTLNSIERIKEKYLIMSSCFISPLFCLYWSVLSSKKNSKLSPRDIFKVIFCRCFLCVSCGVFDRLEGRFTCGET